jgi:hypothetical protein
MPDIFPGSALVDIYLKLHEDEDFQEEYRYLIESQNGTPLGRFFEILNEAAGDERIQKLKDFFLDYHIPFPEDKHHYFVDFKYQNLKSNRELQIVLDLYCYAYEKCLPNIGDYEKEREQLKVIRGQLTEEEMDYVVLGESPTMEEGETELNKEKLRYYINKAHMQDESQIVPHYKKLLESSIADYREVKSPTIENFLSMIGTIEQVLPIIGSKEVKELLLAMDFANLGGGEIEVVEALDDGVAKSFLEYKIKEDKFKSVISSYTSSSPTIKDFKSLIQEINMALEDLDANDVRKILLKMDFTKLKRSEIKEINKLKDRDVAKKLLQDKIKEDKVLKEANLISKAYPNSQAAKDILKEIVALTQSGETVRLTTACKNAYQNYDGDKGDYKKEILKLCAPKVRVRIRKSLEEIDENLELSQERASRRPNIIGYVRQLFQRFQGQRNEGELEIGQESDAKLEEAESELVAISNTVVQSVNEEYGLASAHFGKMIKEVREKNRDHQMFKADTLANDLLVKTGDLISELIPHSGGRDQIVINSLSQYCIENKKSPLAEVIDIISKINGLVGFARQVKLLYESAKEDPDLFKDPLILQANAYTTAHNELVSQLRGTKYANIIPRLEEAKALVDAIPLVSLRDSERRTLR